MLKGSQTPVPMACTDFNKLIERWEVHGNDSAFGDSVVRDPLVVFRENSFEGGSEMGQSVSSVVVAEGS